MKKLLLFFSILLVLVFIVKQCNMYKVVSVLSEDDLKWIDVYKVNDTLYFISNLDNKDTVIVKNKYIKNNKNRFKSSFNLDCYKLGHAIVYFEFIHNRKHHDGNFWIKKGGDGITNYFHWKIGPFITNDNEPYILIGRKMELSTIKINDSFLYDCLVGDLENSHWKKQLNESDSCFLVEQVLFSKDFGLLKYRIGDELYKRCK